MVKKSRNKRSNNKGSALLYVMFMLIIVTIILSGALYASYRNAVVTNDYSSSEQDFIKCDSALEALRGQLAARLTGKTVSEFNQYVNNKSNGFGKETVVSSEYTLYYKQLLPEEYYELFVVEPENDTMKIFLDTSELQVDAVVEYGSVRIITSLNAVIDASGKIGDIRLMNYRIESVFSVPPPIAETAQTPEQTEGGNE